jgi:hypothetical protein
MTSREMVTDAMSESREAAKQEILTKIEELLASGSMSVVNGIVGLSLIKTFIVFMDEE